MTNTVATAKLHHYTGPKNWGDLETWCNLESLVQFEGILEIAAHVLDIYLAPSIRFLVRGRIE